MSYNPKNENKSHEFDEKDELYDYEGWNDDDDNGDGEDEDWNNDESETMKEKLHSFKNALIQSNRIDTSNSSLDQILSNISSVQSTPLGQLMRNSIENAMDEFAEGVSTEEKIAILGELMKSLL